MKLSEALREVRKAFPETFVSVQVEAAMHHDGEIRIEWGAYAHNHKLHSGYPTFEGALSALKKEAGKKVNCEDVEVEELADKEAGNGN